MSKITKLTLMLVLTAVTLGNAQNNEPRPSPPASAYTQVGITDVTIDYFRPKMKGRKIFGEGDDFLVPFGKIWRTGANSGSKLTLSTEATIGGKKVPAGEYLIFTIPGKSDWSFMLYKDRTIGGNVKAYASENEVLKVTAKGSKLSEAVETFTFQITDLSEDGSKANITLSWSNTAVKVPIEVTW